MTATTPDRPVVCAGDSITHGWFSANYVREVEQRLGLKVVNAGVDSDLAWNLLQRLDPIVASDPAVITILIGTNDILTTYSGVSRWWYKHHRSLPQPATIDWFAENLDAIVQRFQAETSARIAVVDLPPIGEDPSGRLNIEVARYNARLREVAAARQVPVLALNERLVEMLPAGAQGGRDWDPPLMLRGALDHYILGRSWNLVSASHGMRVLTDKVHLNDRAGQVVADLVWGFVVEAG